MYLITYSVTSLYTYLKKQNVYIRVLEKEKRPITDVPVTKGMLLSMIRMSPYVQQSIYFLCVIEKTPMEIITTFQV